MRPRPGRFKLVVFHRNYCRYTESRVILLDMPYSYAYDLYSLTDKATANYVVYRTSYLKCVVFSFFRPKKNRPIRTIPRQTG